MLEFMRWDDSYECPQHTFYGELEKIIPELSLCEVVVGCGEGVMYLKSQGRPTDIGLE